MSGAVALPDRGYLSTGQPDEAVLDRIADAGYAAVVDLRGIDESRGIDEAGEVERRGMRYFSLPVSTPADLTPENVRRLKAFLDATDGPLLLHCISGNRVGSLFAIAARDEGSTIEEAMGLGSATVGAFDDDLLQRLLRLPEDESPLAILPLGYRR